MDREETKVKEISASYRRWQLGWRAGNRLSRAEEVTAKVLQRDYQKQWFNFLPPPSATGELGFMLEKLNKSGFRSSPQGQWQIGVRLELKQRDEVKIHVRSCGAQPPSLVLLHECQQSSLSDRRLEDWLFYFLNKTERSPRKDLRIWHLGLSK